MQHPVQGSIVPDLFTADIVSHGPVVLYFNAEHLLDGGLVIEESPFAQCGPAVVERTPAPCLADFPERDVTPAVDEVNQPDVPL